MLNVKPRISTYMYERESIVKNSPLIEPIYSYIFQRFLYQAVEFLDRFSKQSL